MKRFAAVLLALVLCVCGLAEDFPGRADALLSALQAQSGVSSEKEYSQSVLIPGVGSQSDWVAIALCALGKDMTAYADALESYAEDADITNPSTALRVALTLQLCGRGEHPFVQKTLTEKIGTRGIVTWIYGVHIIKNGGDFPLSEAVSHILSLENEDGGWSVTGGVSDPDVTAMVLQALAGCEGAEDAVERGLAFLSSAQRENGGFASYGVYNAESAAQVLIALYCLGIDPETDERFLKNGQSPWDALNSFCPENGLYCHAEGSGASDMASAQTLCAFASAVSGSIFTARITESTQKSYKVIAIPAILLAAVLLCVVLALKHKKSPKSYCAVGLCVLVLCAAVYFTDIETPQNYYGTEEADKGEPVGSVTLEIRCDTAAGQSGAEFAGGCILPETEIALYENDTVYDVLVRAARLNSLSLDCENATGISTQSVYVSGIAQLYELQFGDLSGWVYHVNGVSPSVGCGSYSPKDGDRVQWLYTLDLGKDVEQKNANP